jgi:hypothetical protein
VPTRLADEVRADRDMSEHELLRSVLKLAKANGWKCFHTRQGRASWHLGSGFPDLVLVHPPTGRLLFWELKREMASLDPEQVKWEEYLSRTGHAMSTIRPSDLRLGVVHAVLTAPV